MLVPLIPTPLHITLTISCIRMYVHIYGEVSEESLSMGASAVHPQNQARSEHNVGNGVKELVRDRLWGSSWLQTKE